MIKELLGILGIIILLIEVYQYIRRYRLRRLIEKKKKEKRSCKPAVLRPKGELGKIAATAVIVKRERGNEQQRPAKRLYPGSYGRDEEGKKRKSAQKGTSSK